MDDYSYDYDKLYLSQVLENKIKYAVETYIINRHIARDEIENSLGRLIELVNTDLEFVSSFIRYYFDYSGRLFDFGTFAINGGFFDETDKDEFVRIVSIMSLGKYARIRDNYKTDLAFCISKVCYTYLMDYNIDLIVEIITAFDNVPILK